jgi:DNA helicase-2/ATP-dependent DNA helicase PcrA
MPSIDEILTAELTVPQKDAATDTSKEVIALACAGSGKSRTLAYRVAWLIAEKDADPKSIVGFTFTDKAADSMKRQVALALTKCGVDPLVLGAMYFGTIHSYCYNLLSQMDARYRQFEVLDENRLKLYLISRYYGLELNTLQAAKNTKYFPTVREVSNAWKTMNDELLSITDITAYDQRLGVTLARLSARLNSDNYIDFSLMIRLVVDALQQGNPEALATLSGLRHLMVDEYQDVNPSQEKLISLMHGVSETLFVVGDDDQAIYAWRGADVGNILSFHQRYPQASPSHTLDFNFRSTPAIVQAADGFIRAELA